MSATVASTSKLMHTNQREQHSPFFKLPPEMRNTVYGEILIYGDIPVECKSIHEQTNILRVCQQIRNEAIQIFYSKNRFVIDNESAQCIQLQNFLSTTDQDNAEVITAMAFRPRFPSELNEALAILARTRQGATRPEAERAVVARFGTEDRADFGSVMKGFPSDEHRVMATLVRTLIEQQVPHDSISAECTRAHYSDAHRAAVLENVKSDFVKALCVSFELCVQELFARLDDLFTTAVEDMDDEPESTESR